MAHGGKRVGAGRKQGSANKLDQKVREQADDGGLMPAPYLLSLVRDESLKMEERRTAAIAAAPYYHARLQSSEVKGNVRVEIIDLADAHDTDTE